MAEEELQQVQLDRQGEEPETVLTTVEFKEKLSVSSPPPPSKIIYVSTRGLSQKLGELERQIICSFLGPTDLLRLSETCKVFYLSSTVGDIWLNFTVLAWSSRSFNSPHAVLPVLPVAAAPTTEDDKSSVLPPQPQPATLPSHVRTLISRIKELPISAVTRALQRVDTTFCAEKPEYQALLKALLLFGLRREYSKPGLKVTYPAWALRVDDAKATYFHALKELRPTSRIAPTHAEVCAMTWHFHFKHHEMGDDNREGVLAKFFDDFTMTSQMHGQVMTWAWVDGPRGAMIQVEQYPALTISVIQATGAWRMDNHYVWFEQVTSLPPDKISLLP